MSRTLPVVTCIAVVVALGVAAACGLGLVVLRVFQHWGRSYF
jgi:hypothetical protein